jgi:hypothetical protein
MATTITNVNLPVANTGETAFNNAWGPQVIAVLQALDTQLVTAGFNKNFADYVLSRATIKDYGETKQDVTGATSTTVDIESGNVAVISLGTAITTLTISNPPATGTAGSITLVFVKDNSGTSRSITFPASFVFSDQSGTPAALTVANSVLIVSAVTYDAGTTWRASWATWAS